jgi:hypothetical protein
MRAMIHYSDDDLSWHALRPQGEVAAHLSRCAECRALYDQQQRVDAGLAERATWTFHADLRRGGDPVRRALLETASRLAREVAEARERLAKLIAESVKFAYDGIAIEPALRTAGAVRFLCDAAHDECERQPVHARNLADVALQIANGLDPDRHYLGRKVHHLVGLAQKERANAFRYLGNYPAALDALDGARHAYQRAGASPWDEAVLLYTRGVVLYRFAGTEAERCAEESAAIFAAAEDWVRWIHARMLGAESKFWRQDYRAAADEYRQLLSRARREGDDVLVARLLCSAANCDIELALAHIAEAPLLQALRVFEQASLKTEMASVRWALARIPLIDGQFGVATALLRNVKTDFERLGASNDAALVALDLAEVLVATHAAARDVQKLCRESFLTFRRAGMLNEALTALAYLREAARTGTITRRKIRHVRRFVMRVQEQPTVRFEPPAE